MDCYRHSVLLCLAVALLTAAGGCSSNQKPTYPAKGKLVWEDGSNAKELAGGMIIFQCDAEQISAKAPINEQGGFVLGTYTSDDGAVAGQHKVAIAQPAAESAGDYKPLQIVDRKYETMESTDLAATIEAQANDLVLKVTPGAWMKKQKR